MPLRVSTGNLPREAPQIKAVNGCCLFSKGDTIRRGYQCHIGKPRRGCHDGREFQGEVSHVRSNCLDQKHGVGRQEGRMSPVQGPIRRRCSTIAKPEAASTEKPAGAPTPVKAQGRHCPSLASPPPANPRRQKRTVSSDDNRRLRPPNPRLLLHRPSHKLLPG